jgi:hypothetical protein
MSSTTLSESRWTGGARPIFWALLGGTIAIALVDLYPTRSIVGLGLTTASAFGSYGLIFSAAARPSKWWVSLWALLPASAVALLPYGVITSPLRVMRYLGDLVATDVVILVVAFLAIALSMRLMDLLPFRKSVREPKKVWPEKAEFQRQKLAKVRAAGLTDTTLTHRLGKMIDYAVGRVDYYEDLRHRHLTIGLGLVTGATAIAGFLWRGTAEIPALAAILLGVGALWLLGIGTWLIYYYNHTSSPTYIYRAVADIRSWFYAYNLPPGSSKVLSSDEETAKSQLVTVQENFTKFLDRWIEWAKNKEALLAEDLEQVFILQFIQGYKNEAVRSMQRALAIGLYGFAITIFLALVAWLVGIFWA